MPIVLPPGPTDEKTNTRKTTRWEPRKNRIFISAAKRATAEGHRCGKCFTTTGWEHIRELFNKHAEKDWTTAQLKNYWAVMRTEHKLLFELLQCTGIQYGLNNRGIIEASDWWWEQKLKVTWSAG